MLPTGYEDWLFLSPVEVPTGDSGALTRGAAVYTAAQGEVERSRTALDSTAAEANGAAWSGYGAAHFAVAARGLTIAYVLTADALAKGATALRTYATALSDAQQTAHRATGAGLASAGIASIARDAAGPDRVTMMQASGNSGSSASSGSNPTVSQVLKTKLGSITRAPLPPGSPSWSDIGDMTMDEVRAAARANQPGFKTILKLLTDSRFNR
jgi:hypothetical protein